VSVRVADVERTHLAAAHQAHEAFDGVVHVAEAAAAAPAMSEVPLDAG